MEGTTRNKAIQTEAAKTQREDILKANVQAKEVCGGKGRKTPRKNAVCKAKRAAESIRTTGIRTEEKITKVTKILRSDQIPFHDRDLGEGGTEAKIMKDCNRAIAEALTAKESNKLILTEGKDNVVTLVLRADQIPLYDRQLGKAGIQASIMKDCNNVGNSRAKFAAKERKEFIPVDFDLDYLCASNV